MSVISNFEELANRLRASTVRIVSHHGGGSGVVWDEGGAIVSNAHVVPGDGPTVIYPNGVRGRAKVLHRDDRLDLVVLSGKPGLAPAAVIGDSSRLGAGQLVIAVGNPLGFTGAVSAGVIHSTCERWVRANVRLAPGNSGGMLANADGQVVGINTMICGGLGMAIPSNKAATFMRNESNDPRLGIEVLPAAGRWMIVGIERNSLAERAGVQLGDFLGITPDQLRAALGELPAVIPLERSGSKRMLRVSRRTERRAA